MCTVDEKAASIRLNFALTEIAPVEDYTHRLTIFIKQCKNTCDSSTRRVLVMRHVLVGYELHENFSKHIGKLVCRHGAKPCNKETELLGTLKASITTT